MFDSCWQDTCTGFLLGGVGELDKNRRPNFYVVEKSMYRSLHKAPPFIRSTSQLNTAGHRLLRALLNNRQLVAYGIATAAAVTTTTSISAASTATTTIQLSLLLLVLFHLCGSMSPLSFGAWPSDHYFRSVCWFVCLSVCLFVQSFSHPSLIRFRSN